MTEPQRWWNSYTRFRSLGGKALVAARETCLAVGARLAESVAKRSSRLSDTLRRLAEAIGLRPKATASATATRECGPGTESASSASAPQGGIARLDREKLMDLKLTNERLLEEDRRQRRFVFSSWPTFVALQTDWKCNLHCIMCGRNWVPPEELSAKPTIDENTFVRLAEETFPRARFLQLNSAGEPLMSPRLDLEIELAERFAVKLAVVTNGMLLDLKRGRIERVVRNAANLAFSFDSPVKETYESIRVGSSFETVVENMRRFHALCSRMPQGERPGFGIIMVIMRRNLGEVLQMVRFAKDIGADSLELFRLLVHAPALQPEALENCRALADKTVLEAIALAKQLNLRLITGPLFGSPAAADKGLPTAATRRRAELCPFLAGRVYVDEFARIRPCCAGGMPPVGDYSAASSFDEIWNGEMYQLMRKTFVGGGEHPYCSSCAESGFLATVEGTL